MILKLQLFNNTFTDNHNHIGKFADLNAQNTYFENLPKLEMDGNFNKIGDEIVITGDYSVMAGYNYGRFKYHNIWYYFSVIDYRVANETKLHIVYSLDYYETARYQFDISIGKGTINNITTEYDVIKKIPKEYNGLGKRIETPISVSDMAGILLYVHRSSNNTSEIYYYNDARNNFFTKVLSGSIFDIFVTNHIIDSYDDIRGCWLLPSMFYGLINDNPTDWNYVITEDDYNIRRYAGYNPDNLGGTLSIRIKRTDEEYTIFKDCRGSEIWQSPNGYYQDEIKTIKYRLDLSSNSCVVRLFTDDNVNKDNIVSLSLETMDVFNDAFTEYNARQRFADIENRQLTKEQNAWMSGLNIGGQILGGTVGGLATAGPVGAGVGAVIGATSGIIGTVGGYLVDEYYGNKQQDVIDHQYRNAYDNLLLQGNGVSLLYMNYLRCGFYEVKYVTDLGYPRKEKSIETYGYNVNQHYPNIQNYIDYLMSVSGEHYLRGNFEINGHIPDNWKQKIKDRFNGGVTFG